MTTVFRRTAQVPDFEVEVLVPLPAGEQPPPLPMTVRYLPASEINRLTREDLSKFARAAVTGWRDHEDPFSAEAFENFLDQYPTAPRAIWDAYSRALVEAKRKN